MVRPVGTTGRLAGRPRPDRSPSRSQFVLLDMIRKGPLNQAMGPVRAVALPPEAPAAARGSEGVLTAGALAGFGYGLLWLLVVGQASLGSLLVYFLALVLLAASVGVSAGVVSLAVAQGSAGRPSLT